MWHKCFKHKQRRLKYELSFNGSISHCKRFVLIINSHVLRRQFETRRILFCMCNGINILKITCILFTVCLVSSHPLFPDMFHSCDQQLYRSLCWSVHKNSLLLGGHSLDLRAMDVKCVCEGVFAFAKRGRGNGSGLL